MDYSARVYAGYVALSRDYAQTAVDTGLGATVASKAVLNLKLSGELCCYSSPIHINV